MVIVCLTFEPTAIVPLSVVSWEAILGGDGNLNVLCLLGLKLDTLVLLGLTGDSGFR